MYHHIEDDKPQRAETLGMTHYEVSNYVFPDVSGWNSSPTTAPVAENEVELKKNPLNNSLDTTTLRIASIELSTSGNNKRQKHQKTTTEATTVDTASLLTNSGNNKKRGRDQLDLLRNLDAEKLKEALVDCLTRQKSINFDVRQQKLATQLEATLPSKSLSTPALLPSMNSMLLSDVIEQYDSLNHSMFYNSSPLKRQPFEIPPPLMSLETSVSEMYANAAKLTVRDFNQEFQEIKESITEIVKSRGEKTSINYCLVNPDPQLRVLLERSEKLMEDFFYAAKTYSRIIVSEFNLPEEQKTIKPGSKNFLIKRRPPPPKKKKKKTIQHPQFPKNPFVFCFNG